MEYKPPAKKKRTRTRIDLLSSRIYDKSGQLIFYGQRKLQEKAKP
jgi:hypothetical protein